MKFPATPNVLVVLGRTLGVMVLVASLAMAPSAAWAKDGGGSSGGGGGSSGGGSSGGGGSDGGGGSSGGSGSSDGGGSGGGSDSGGSSGSSGDGGSGSGGEGSSSSTNSGSGSASGRDGKDSGSGRRAEKGVSQDRVRDAVRKGAIMPLAKVLPRLRKTVAGSVIDIALDEEAGGGWTYRFAILGAKGEYTDVRVNARTNEILDVRQR